MREQPPCPTPSTPLLDYPWIIVRFRCHYCKRARDSRLAALAARYGPETMVGELIHVFMSRCLWSPRNPEWKLRKYGHKCGAYCPDLWRVGPPDLPLSMTGFTVIDGGKNDQLPAERKGEPNRRRVGADDE